MNIDQVGGHTFPAREFVPEEVLAVALFAQAIGSPEKSYYSTDGARAAGFPARPLPPSILAFFHTVDESDLTEVLGVRYGKTLAAGVESVFGVTPHEQDTIIGRTWVDEAYEKAGRDGKSRQFLVLATEFRVKATDEMISQTRITFIERGE